ncbi:MAG: GDP-mannose 4,6-dehydratase [Dehalococcoidia bacterium]
MESVLVTGGAGFIGSHLCERLLSRNKNVVCLDNFDPYYSPEVKKKNIQKALKDKHFHLAECDIRDKGKLARLFSSGTFDAVVHLAARAGVRPSIKDPHVYQDVNIGGTINLLEMCREHGIKRFVFGSSSSVYGDNSVVPFSEKDVLMKPISPYAASKQACELFCYTYHHLYDINITCLRFFTVYGPRQRPDMAIHKFTRLIDGGKHIEIYGDGSSRRDYTYIDDIIDGVEASIDKDLAFEIINLGESETTELKRLVSLIEENIGKKAKVKRLPMQPGDVPITYADISKAKKLLGYKPKVKVEAGIPSFVKWYKDQER